MSCLWGENFSLTIGLNGSSDLLAGLAGPGCSALSVSRQDYAYSARVRNSRLRKGAYDRPLGGNHISCAEFPSLESLEVHIVPRNRKRGMAGSGGPHRHSEGYKPPVQQDIEARRPLRCCPHSDKGRRYLFSLSLHEPHARTTLTR
jgi:hypothetical protein